MVNYENSFIYKIVCNDENIKSCYVGATTGFNSRKNSHKMTCHNENAPNHNIKLYKFIRENGGWNNWKMVLIEEVCCENKLELSKKEREYMESLEADLNTNKAYITREEKNKNSLEYYHSHKAIIKEQRAEYFKQYNDRTKEQRREYYKEYNKREDVKARNRYLYFKKKRERQLMENNE